MCDQGASDDGGLTSTEQTAHAVTTSWSACGVQGEEYFSASDGPTPLRIK